MAITHPTHNPEPEASNAAPGRLELVREFINTAELDHDRDRLSDPAGLKSWLIEKQLISPQVAIDATDLERTIEFRESLRDLLTGHTAGEVGPAAIKRFDAVVAGIPMRLRVDDTGWVRVDAAGKGFDGALGELLAVTHAAMDDESWQRMKACADVTCRWAFFDRSKNRSGHWCDMSTCGNRNKVSAYRKRHTAAPSRKTAHK
jgi:predicted RNA-binding Zn ribbon-like protein